MSFLTKLREAGPKWLHKTPTHGSCAWSVYAAKLVMMALSELARRHCSTTWRSSNAVEERVQAVGWRRLCAS